MAFNSIDPQTGQVVFGLTIQDSEELLQTLNDNVISNLIAETGNPLATTDTSKLSVVGRLNKVFADRMTAMWEYVKGIEDTMYVDTSYGSHLTKLSMLVGVSRILPSPSRGLLTLTADNGTLIPSSTLFSSLRGDMFRIDNPVEVNTSKCISLDVVLTDELPNKVHQITIDGRSFVSNLVNPMEDLVEKLQADTLTDSTLVDGVIHIEVKDFNNTIDVTLSSLLIAENVQIDVPCSSVENGVIFGDSDTIVNIETSTSGLISVRNREDFILGTVYETDSELRTRISSQSTSVGTSTLDSLETLLTNNPSVAALHIEENRSFETNANGVPPKSFEVIIHHVGEDEGDIAEVIWRNKPLGIYSHGINAFSVNDLRGFNHTVRYTVAQPLEAYFRVTFRRLINDSETIPIGVEALIQEAIAVEGSKYKVSQDVIGKRFYGAIFKATTGISELDVQVALVPLGSPEPQLNQYSPKGSVSRIQIATFAPSRVTATRII